jgi:hypothetical protein
MKSERSGASFRDPSGFVYTADGVLYRQVNPSYLQHYDLLMSSGLYDALVAKGWLVRHEVMPGDSEAGSTRILRPDRIPYVSYPYEWCFSQLKDAALLTLDIAMVSLAHGMTLKDASAFNVQFVGSQPVFIDTLSFERYEDGVPWVAYRQFCQHFLAPLALMSHVDTRVGHLLRAYIDGIPLDLASHLLPAATRLRPGLLLHIHGHARSQRRHADAGRARSAIRPRPLPKSRLIALLDNLRNTVRRCELRQAATEWGDYYDDTSYSDAAMSAKEAAVKHLVAAVAQPEDIVHDFGANTGRFSRLLAEEGRYVVSHDIDPLAVERNYTYNRSNGVIRVLPLLLDLTNPSPAIGWSLTERTSALDRVSRGTVVALALVHHLAIANNVPLPHLAEFFAGVANALIIEFVPKEDLQVQRLLATRQDIFPDYSREGFERAFAAHFDVHALQAVTGTPRTVFAMTRRR